MNGDVVNMTDRNATAGATDCGHVTGRLRDRTGTGSLLKNRAAESVDSSDVTASPKTTAQTKTNCIQLPPHLFSKYRHVFAGTGGRFNGSSGRRRLSVRSDEDGTRYSFSTVVADRKTISVDHPSSIRCSRQQLSGDRRPRTEPCKGRSHFSLQISPNLASSKSDYGRHQPTPPISASAKPQSKPAARCLDRATNGDAVDDDDDDSGIHRDLPARSPIQQPSTRAWESKEAAPSWSRVFAPAEDAKDPSPTTVGSDARADVGSERANASEKPEVSGADRPPRRRSLHSGVFSRMSEEARLAADEVHQSTTSDTRTTSSSGLQASDDRKCNSSEDGGAGFPATGRSSLRCADRQRKVPAAQTTPRGRAGRNATQETARCGPPTGTGNAAASMTSSKSSGTRLTTSVYGRHAPIVGRPSGGGGGSVWRVTPECDDDVGNFRITSAAYDSRYVDLVLGRTTDSADNDPEPVDEYTRLRAVAKCTAWLHKHV